MSVSNRAYIEKLIYDTFDAIDPSGTNTDKYKTLFSILLSSKLGINTL